MTRFFHRTDDDTPEAERSEAPAVDAAIEEAPTARRAPRRRSSARKSTSGARKTTTATTAKKATPSRRGSARKADSADSNETAAKKTTRRRAPRKAAPSTRPPATPATPPSEEDEVHELLGLLRTQAGLIETQNELLKSLVDAQAETIRAIRGVGTSSVGDGGPAMEVKLRLAVFVDVPNILYAAERSGVVLDWGKVLDFLSTGRTLVRATAYAPISDDPAARRENERFVVPFMDRGYRIATKPLKRFTGGSVKANFDVELAVDIVTMADRLDVIVLVSGDGDFRRVVEMVGNRGVRVEVMAFGNSTSQDLRETADRYIDIAAYVPELTK